MTDQTTINELAVELDQALLTAKPVARISDRHPDFTIDDAYAVSLGLLERRKARGEKLVGKKIGLTAEAIQKALGIDEPDFGFLTDAMESANGSNVSLDGRFIVPMLEVEIAFVLSHDLPTSGVTAEQVLEATEYVMPCFELVDTRFGTMQITIVDTVADNASSVGYVLGDRRTDPRTLDLAEVRCTLSRNGEPMHEGLGAVVMGSPANSVAWLANRLGEYGVRLEAGDVVLPGAMAPFAPIEAGDHYQATFSDLGSVQISFR